MAISVSYETDILQTPAGDIKFTFLGHGSLMLQFAEKVIYVDPFTQVADYSELPKADLILITGEGLVSDEGIMLTSQPREKLLYIGPSTVGTANILHCEHFCPFGRANLQTSED